MPGPSVEISYCWECGYPDLESVCGHCGALRDSLGPGMMLPTSATPSGDEIRSHASQSTASATSSIPSTWRGTAWLDDRQGTTLNESKRAGQANTVSGVPLMNETSRNINSADTVNLSEPMPKQNAHLENLQPDKDMKTGFLYPEDIHPAIQNQLISALDGSPTALFSQYSPSFPTSDSFREEGYLSPTTPLQGGHLCTLRQLEYEPAPEPELLMETADDDEQILLWQEHEAESSKQGRSGLTQPRKAARDTEGYPSLHTHKANHHQDPLSAAHEVQWDAIHYGKLRNYSHSESSGSSSYANSLVSTASLASSATDLSRNTGYSAIQIARATKELIRVLQDDPDLARLYKRAIVDPSIGPEKLERNLRRSFRNYADILRRASDDTLEYLASRLVKLKARAVAQVIVQNHGPNNSTKPIRQDQEQSSDEEPDAHPVDECIFEDIISFREFLVGGEAFTMLHSQIRSFVLPKPERGEDIEVVSGDQDERVRIPDTGPRDTDSSMNHSSPSSAYDRAEQLHVAMSDQETPRPSFTTNLGNMNTSDYAYTAMSWLRALITFAKVFTSIALVACGYLEPPLEDGFTRLRWTCRCGDELHGDVVEFRAGGISRLIERMQRSIGTKVMATTYSENVPNQKYFLPASAWVRAATRKISSAFSRSENLKECLPRHANQATPSTSTRSGSSHTPVQNLLLMSCMQGDQQLRRIVHQDPIDDITTDKALFTFMKVQLTKRRNSLSHLLSLRSIQGLHFVKFRLWASGDAEVYDSCCTSPTPHACQRIPPATIVEPSKNAEYRCTPAGPLDVGPPIVSRLMLHWLKSPECVHEDETLVLDQLPKRTCGKLEGKVRHPADGWGLHFEEGQDYRILANMLLSALTASLLFAICWSYFKDDVQGAFGVAQYIVGLAVAFVALVANRSGRLG